MIGKRAIHFSAVLVLSTALALHHAAAQQSAESPEPQQQRQKQEELLRKKRRFDRLDAREQQELREFHQELSADPEREKLTRVMLVYEDWLNNLRPGERAELLSLPPDARIERIRKLIQDQANERLRRYARSSLTRDDAAAVNNWVQSVISRRATELEKRLSEESREEYEQMSEFRQRFRLTMTWLQLPTTEMGLLESEVEELKSQLSASAKAVIEEQPDAPKRDQMIRELINAAAVSRMGSRGGGFEVKEEDLWKFYSQLDPKSRAYLEGMPSGQLRRELQRLYYLRRRGRGGPSGSRYGDRGSGDRGSEGSGDP